MIRIKHGDWVLLDKESPMLKEGYPPGPLKWNKPYRVLAVMHQKDINGFSLVKISYGQTIGTYTMGWLKKLDKKYNALASLLYG